MSVERGYQEIKTPLLYDAELWEISGHWDKYRENMFVTESEDKPMGLKPMNCPGHCAFYAMGKHSYRELPIRYAEPGLLHRNEPSGTLHGLLRVRHFIQDDAHIFCTEEQVEQEVLDCLEFGFAWYDQFGFDMRIELSTRPEQRIGTDEMWDRSEAALQAALDARRLRVRRSTRATARSTGRRSTSTCATRSAARGSSAPSSSTTTSPSASTSPTPAPTTPSTSRR